MRSAELVSASAVKDSILRHPLDDKAYENRGAPRTRARLPRYHSPRDLAHSLSAHALEQEAEARPHARESRLEHLVQDLVP